MSETRLNQTLAYLTDSIGRLNKQIDGLRNEVERLHRAVTTATKIEREILKEEKQKLRDEGRDHERIARFERYQAGEGKVDIPSIPAGPDRFA